MDQSRTGDRVARLFRLLYWIVACVLPGLLVALLVGSLILSGGQVGDSMKTKWGVVVPYPIFRVSTTLLVVVGVCLIVLAIAVVLTNRASDEAQVQRLIGPTLASAGSAFGFSLAFPDGGVRMGDGLLGDQWPTSLLSLVAFAVLLAGMAATRSRERARA